MNITEYEDAHKVRGKNSGRISTGQSVACALHTPRASVCLSACLPARLSVCVRVCVPSRRVCRDDLRCSRHELHSDERRVMTAQRVDLLLSERRPHAHLVIGAGAQQKTILVRIRYGDHTSAAQTHGQTQGREEKSNEQWPCEWQNSGESTCSKQSAVARSVPI